MTKSLEKNKRPKGGPRSVEGRLTVATNAAKHGILSPKPVIAAFESESGWKTHRQSILDALSPEGGVEQILAERVALNSWRLNRVIVFETESIAAEQETVLEEVRKDREQTLKLASLYAREAKDIIAGTFIEELVDDPTQLSDYAVELLSPPEVALEGVENARRHYESVVALFDAAPDTTVSRFDVGWLFEKSPYYAVESTVLDEE